jgi:hypothetical protein
MLNKWPVGTDDEIRAYLTTVIIRCEGNLKRVAWEAGIGSRDKLWRKLKALKLWPIVNEARRKRAERMLKWKTKLRLLHGISQDQDR